MKQLLLFFLFTTILTAQERPKIALVLSGGAARGAAHVGVLKVLEANRIPIDMIVGTSMGAFMGGLYVSGKTPDEIEHILISTDWNKYITADFDRSKIPMQRKQDEYWYQGRLGFGIDVYNNAVLPTGVLKREPLLLQFKSLTANVATVRNFDKLRIPFRAVASNIKNGESVVLKSGSLAEAIYASSAIPGGLQPIEIDGKDLVDGGVSQNMPIQVAKNMGADIIIAVDVSENFAEKVNVNSYFVVMKQLVDILTRKNVNDSLKLLTQKDILIRPDLKNYSGLDVTKYKEIVDEGYRAALEQLPQLKKYSLSKEAYKRYCQKYGKTQKSSKTIIDAIAIKNTTYLSDEIIKSYLHQEIGKPFDAQQVNKDISDLYQLSVFDSVDYNIQKVQNKNILKITTTPSWNNHGQLLFSLSLGDDFHGHSSYSLKAGYFMFGINALGAEWRIDTEIGKKQHYFTSFYQPLDVLQKFYIKPFLSYESMTYIIPDKNLGNQELQSSGYGGGVVLGSNVSRSFRIQLSAESYMDTTAIPLFHYDENFNARMLKVDFLYDNLDNYNFPNSGFLGKLELKKDAKLWGSDYDYEQLYMSIQKPFTYKDNTFIFNAEFAVTDVKSRSNIPQVTVYDKFFLGGMFHLSGYQEYAFATNNVAFSSLMYRYRLKNGGFFGSLGMPLYAGATLESAQAWNRGTTLKYSSLKYAASLFVAADTPLGALYFTYGKAEAHHNSLYLYLGEKF